MSFSGQIKKFNDKTVKAVEMIFRGTALDLFGKITQRTPVKTGRLRLNWQATINKPASGTIESEQNADSVIGTARIGDSVFIVNNLPYAQSIENGSSTQAPSGMVGITVTEFKQHVKANSKK